LNHGSDGTISQPSIFLFRFHIHSRNQKFSSGCDIVLRYHRKIRHLILGRYCRYLRFVAGSLIPICIGIQKNKSVGLNRLSIFFLH
jgi:hypothetical protein